MQMVSFSQNGYLILVTFDHVFGNKFEVETLFKGRGWGSILRGDFGALIFFSISHPFYGIGKFILSLRFCDVTKLVWFRKYIGNGIKNIS